MIYNITMKVLDTYEKHQEAPAFESFQAEKWPWLCTDTFEGICPACGVLAEDIRGRIAEHPKCVDISLAGICPSCGGVTFFRRRYYPEEGRWLICNKHGWYEFFEGGQKQRIVSRGLQRLKSILGLAG